MTSLRYFIPLTIEANKRNIKSRYFVSSSGKYNSPLIEKNYKHLQELSNLHNFDIFQANEAKKYPGVFFLIEGDLIELLDHNHKKISLTYMTDFSVAGIYEKYIDSVDYVIFPSKFIADHYDKKSQKNLYLGSPKYDIAYDSNEIYKKYNINPSGKKAFVVLPRTRDIGKIDFGALYDTLRESGYDIITKTRGKDPFSQKEICGDYHFVDFSWFPHDSMELMHIADFVVNFDSTSIKEAVMMRTPIINFNIKPFNQILDFLYKEDYCIDIKGEVEYNKIANYIDDIVQVEAFQFDEAIEKYLFNFNSSQRILDYVLKND